VLQNIVRPAAEKATDECEALPSRKRLIKRMKKLALSFAGNESAPDDDKDEALQANPNIVTKVETKYGFCVINQQTDRHNALLAAMLRGQLSLKQSTKPATKIKYSVLVFDEISARINDLARSDENGPLIQTLEKIRKDLQLYLNTFRKLPRASKNILRVMVSVRTCYQVYVLQETKRLIYYLLIYVFAAWLGPCNAQSRVRASVCL
jgi:hypothetical protein